jgi:mycothiol synthase
MERRVTISSRPYAGGDEAELVRLWIRSVWKDSMNSRRFRDLFLLDANFDPEGLRIAEAGGRLIGAAYAVRRRLPLKGTDLEPDSGWITWFFVDPSWRRMGIAERLVGECLAFLAAKGRKAALFASYTPNYVVPGLDGEAYPEAALLLAKLGFARQYQAVAMDFDMLGYRYPEEIAALKERREAEGFSFRDASDADAVELVRFADEGFNPDWARAAREGAFRGIPADQIAVCRDPAGALCGFAMFGAYEGLLERFGPFGVDESRRGLGLGKILLHECLRRQKAIGVHGSWFLWTSESDAAGSLYLKTGYRITRRFDILKKNLA